MSTDTGDTQFPIQHLFIQSQQEEHRKILQRTDLFHNRFDPVMFSIPEHRHGTNRRLKAKNIRIICHLQCRGTGQKCLGAEGQLLIG